MGDIVPLKRPLPEREASYLICHGCMGDQFVIVCRFCLGKPFVAALVCTACDPPRQIDVRDGFLD